MLQLYTLGGLRIERDGQFLQLPTQRARDLLAYLITFRDRPHPRSVLAGTLWPDLPEDKARRRLSDTLWRVRRVLGDHVVADDDHVWFNLDLPHWLDAKEFEGQVDKYANTHRDRPLSTDPLSTCISELSQALDLYGGPFLDGMYHDWALLERERLRELYLGALCQLLEYQKQAGDYAAALIAAQRLIAVEPLHEAGHRELMCLYHLLGRDAEAVAQYQRCRQILRDELGVSPAPETEAIYRTLSSDAAFPPGAPAVHLPTLARRPAFDLDELPLVGRDVERAALLDHLETAALGRGGIVLLEGEAGIGKSRLVRELIAGARWRNVVALSTAAGESGSSSYAPLLNGLASALSPLRVRQLAHLLDPVHLQAVASLFPRVAQSTSDLPPIPDLPPSQARERFQQALVAIVLGLARVAPHLWVLEDLQWADAETLALLPLLHPHLVDSRTLILLTGRSAELRATPTVWKALQMLDRTGSFSRYTLARLEADAIADLVHQLLSEDNPTVIDCLARESEGVPLYIVEALKAWRDEGSLFPDERGGWHWREDAPVALPVQLGEAVISHRLSHLSSTAKEVLTTAAVIGTEVDFDMLARVCACLGPESGLTLPDQYLLASDELLRMGFLVETEAGYRFSHERVRQAVYRRLSLSQRQHLHHQVALAAESVFSEQPELLAHHFIAAGEREPAIHHLKRAAERSRELFAHQTTLAIYDRLLSLLTHAEDCEARYDVLFDRLKVLNWLGDREAQGHTLEEMFCLAQALSDASCGDVYLARALHQRSEWHRIQGHYGPADEDALAALEIYRRVGDDHGRAILLAQLANNIIYTDDYARACTYFEEALPIFEALGNPKGQIQSLMGLAHAAQYKGDYSTALAYCQRSLDLAQETDNLRWISYAYSAVGLAYIDLGDMDGAEAHLREALRLAETGGERRRQGVTHRYLYYVARERDEFEVAQTHLDIALEVFREVQDVSWEVGTLSDLGELALLRNDPVAACEHLRDAYRRCVELGELPSALAHLSTLTLAELAAGDRAAAWQHSQEVIAELESGRRGLDPVPENYYNHFRVAEATRRWAAARVALDKAVNLLTAQAERISDAAWQEKYLTGLRVNRVITEAAACLPPPGRLRVRLARADVPAHRRPTPDEVVAVTWTVDAGETDAALAEQEGKVVLRRRRLLRLLAEAEAAGALPTIADLAGALDVAPRTIRAALAVLRQQGHTIHTRGAHE